jgi:CRP/FNR family cyclic AMP-dependent transcriptional regulator
LACTLLLLARYGTHDQPKKIVAKTSQETLAEMIGTTRSWVNSFTSKFKKLGFLNYNGGLYIRPCLLGDLLRE